jgi:hypothetical protein
MALENSEVLKELLQQRETAIIEFEKMREIVMRLNGAIEVLQQIEESKEETVTENE